MPDGPPCIFCSCPIDAETVGLSGPYSCHSCRAAKGVAGTLGELMVPLLTRLASGPLPRDRFHELYPWFGADETAGTICGLACRYFGCPEFERQTWSNLLTLLVRRGDAKPRTLVSGHDGREFTIDARNSALLLPRV